MARASVRTPPPDSPLEHKGLGGIAREQGGAIGPGIVPPRIEDGDRGRDPEKPRLTEAGDKGVGVQVENMIGAAGLECALEHRVLLGDQLGIVGAARRDGSGVAQGQQVDALVVQPGQVRVRTGRQPGCKSGRGSRRPAPCRSRGDRRHASRTPEASKRRGPPSASVSGTDWLERWRLKRSVTSISAITAARYGVEKSALRCPPAMRETKSATSVARAPSTSRRVRVSRMSLRATRRA